MMKSAFQSLHKISHGKPVATFIVVGVLAALIHYVVLMVLINTALPNHLGLANIIGFCSAILVSYSGNRFFVFEGKRSHKSSFFIMLIGYLISMWASTLVLVGLVEGVILNGLSGSLAPFGGSFIVALWQWVHDILPSPMASFFFQKESINFTPTAGFLAATFVAAVMNYLWNRFVVFQKRASKS